MRILIDECLPRQLKEWLPTIHDAITVQEAGWTSVKNGKPIRLANDAGYDVLATADKNMHHQQTLAGLHISVVVIPSNRKLLVERSVSALLQSLEMAEPGQKIVMQLGADWNHWGTMRLHSVEHQEDYVSHLFKSPDATA